MALIFRGAQSLLLMAVVTWLFSAGRLSSQAKSSTQAFNRHIHAPWVSCYDETGEHFIGPKDQRTPVLTSPNKIYRAYAEIHAQKAAADECENRAKLFISVRGAKFMPVFSQGASQQNGTATSLGPVAWSPNSRWLVVERGLWSYASDAGGLGLLLYDTQSGKVLKPVIQTAIQNALRKHCELRYEIMGFDARNRIKLQVTDWKDELDDQQSDCIQGTAQWLFDPISLKAFTGQIVR
jgi:hypothetical protein